MHPTTERTDTWSLSAGDEIVPGIYAWALLGDGKRFETWLAWSARHWTAVTVKLPHPGALTSRTRAALAHEAETIARLAHPSVQRLLEAHVDAALPHLVYEYVEGPTLAQLLEEEGQLAPDDVVRLGMQIASVLHYLHAEGVVHLDLKPTNVVLMDGRPVLLDFDIARPVGARGSGAKPRGSAAFMAPEQIRCEAAAPSMDLFALGAVLYEAATNTPAFEPVGEGLDRFYPQLEHDPAPPHLPPRLEAAVLRLLDRDPDRRPPTAAAALALLAEALPDGEEGVWPAWAAALL
jgi:serine/threonine protein kinase